MRVFVRRCKLKVALVTGASSGIGRETAKLFAKNGYFVIAHYNTNRKGVDELITELEGENISGSVFSAQADFNDMDSVKNMFTAINKSFKHIDVLVNNAGAGLYKMITDTTCEEWDKLFNVNVKSTFVLTNLVLKQMISKKCGKIINVSSIWGNNGASMEVAYSASKSALIGYTKALAQEVAPSGITVNCVCPGVIQTKMNSRFSAQEMQELATETPLGRLGTAEEVAELIYFLGSEKASFITGQVITCDGGFAL